MSQKDEQWTVVLGRMYERQKKAAHRPKLEENNGEKFSPFSGSHATAKAIASIAGVTEKTVRHAAEFAKAVDEVKEVSPEAVETVAKEMQKGCKSPVSSIVPRKRAKRANADP